MSDAWRTVCDIVWVARFEVMRALRTWQALALMLVFVLANLGGMEIFLTVLLEVENSLADQFLMPRVRKPGALTATLVSSGRIKEIVGFFVTDGVALDRVLALPMVAVFQQWFGQIFMPFLAATTAAETLAADVQNRTVRYEALRVPRLELVLGRFVGQVSLMVSAASASVVVGGLYAWFRMASQPPLPLMWGMLDAGGRAVLFAVPFVGLGVMASQLYAAPGWARVVALVSAAATYVLYGIGQIPFNHWSSDVFVALMPLLPQAWLSGFWASGAELWTAAVVCNALGLAAVGVGYLRFSGRDL